MQLEDVTSSILRRAGCSSRRQGQGQGASQSSSQDRYKDTAIRRDKDMACLMIHTRMYGVYDDTHST